MELDWASPVKKTTEQDQRSAEWLEWRKKHIGASEIAAVLGESPWSTPFKLWLLKTNQAEEFKGNIYTKRGNDLEPEARDAYCKKTGRHLTIPVLEYKEWPVLSASLDGWCDEDRLVVEIKCPGPKDHAEACVGRVPQKYWYQLQQQMLVAGADHADYVSYDGKEIAVVRVQANPDQQRMIVEKAKEFWKYVETNTPPPTDEVQIDDAETVALVEEFAELDAESKKLEAKIKNVREQIKERVKDDKAVCAGWSIANVFTKGAVEYAEIPELKGIDLEKYRKAGFTKLVIKKAKKT